MPIMLDELPTDLRGWTCIGCKNSAMYGERTTREGSGNSAKKHMAVCEALKTNYPHINTAKQHRSEARMRQHEWFPKKERPVRSNNKIIEGHQIDVRKIGTEIKTDRKHIIIY